MGVSVKSMRETRSGDVLVEVGAKPEDQSKFGEALRGAIGNAGVVRLLVSRAQMDIRDLDASTDETEVRAALLNFFGGEDDGRFKVNLTRANRWGSRMAFVELEERLAVKLENAVHIKIGWINCRVRRRQCLSRCYRCHAFGHLASNCKGEDRSSKCWKCGRAGHRAATCTSKPECYLCASSDGNNGVDHVAGSSRCMVYKKALQNHKWR